MKNKIFRKFRKISFKENRLVICTTKVILGIEKVDKHTSKITSTPSKYRILIEHKKNGTYTGEDPMKPNTYYRWTKLREGSFYGDVGETIIYNFGGFPIERDSRIVLTEKEKKTGKISLKRIEELEKILNS